MDAFKDSNVLQDILFAARNIKKRLFSGDVNFVGTTIINFCRNEGNLASASNYATSRWNNVPLLTEIFQLELCRNIEIDYDTLEDVTTSFIEGFTSSNN